MDVNRMLFQAIQNNWNAKQMPCESRVSRDREKRLRLVMVLINLHASIGDATFSDDLDVFTGQGEPANIKPPQRNLGHSPVQPCVLTLTDGTFGSVDVSRRKSLVYLVIYYLSHIVCSSLVGWNLVGR